MPTIIKMNLNLRETQLKKRLKYPYKWHCKQNNNDDYLTNFIYNIFDFEDLIKEIEKRFSDDSRYKILFDYALNRWFNFWSSQAVEQIFCELQDVIPAKNAKDRLVDFEIKGVKFDHKTSVFPEGYSYDLMMAQEDPRSLILWLYENQSKEQRKHLKNRLFIILYSNQGDHWKLKAEILWLKGLIENYVKNFDITKLHKFTFEKDELTFSDIIWAVK